MIVSNEKKGKRILVVEDDPIIADLIVLKLIKLGYENFSFVAFGEEAIESVNQFKPDFILMDIVLAGLINGIKAGREITIKYGTPIIYMTGVADEVSISSPRPFAAKRPMVV